MKDKILEVYKSSNYTPSNKLLDKIDKFISLINEVNTIIEVEIDSYDYDYSPEIVFIWNKGTDNYIKLFIDDFDVLMLEQQFFHMISYTTLIINEEEFKTIKSAFNLLNNYNKLI